MKKPAGMKYSKVKKAIKKFAPSKSGFLKLKRRVDKLEKLLKDKK